MDPCPICIPTKRFSVSRNIGVSLDVPLCNQPSIRPDDSRYGENPNRLQRHTQFQVILKPNLGNSQQLFINSLSALGIDVIVHDIRFVEDNWESSVLGGWARRFWMDGMEITQFTYFKHAGSLPLSPVSVEITYGLERIIMLLQVIPILPYCSCTHFPL
ncbi:unnamed protein product [Arabidopsis thaliana]|uniref:glycine--tRNA ligase n=1 Tax=Arabidopsis thaliana TaxID=3702 RepID=A0A5S9Y8D3_ARATH|nr:unnamed protein product [Arabidopsis thaliana]